MQSIAGNAAVNQSINRSLQQRSRQSAPAAAARAPASRTGDTQRPIALTFRRDDNVTAQVRKRLIDAMRQRSAAVADDFARKSATSSYRDRFEHQLAREGLSNANLADVAAYHVAVNWAVVHRTAVPRGAGLTALRDQLRASFAQDAKLGGLNEKQRQWLADDMLFRSLNLSDRLDEFARSPDPETQALFSRGAREDVRQSLGLDLQTYRFTAAGLQPGRR